MFPLNYWKIIKFIIIKNRDACLVGETVCDNPNEYLFWDYFHLTTHGHMLITQDATKYTEMKVELLEQDEMET